MKYIRETSDIHLNFDISKWNKTRAYVPGEVRMTCDMDLLWYPDPMEGDDETCMIIAGDLWQARKFLKRKHPDMRQSWMQMLADQFKYVVFVIGNHDFWGSNFHYETDKIKKTIAIQGLQDKVFLLERDSIVLDGVKLVGGTLWTDFNRQSPLVMMQAANAMNDYNYIRAGAGYRSLRAQDLLSNHIGTRKFIFDNAIKDSPDQKLIVVTHMAPSYQSINPRYRVGRDPMNFYYYSDLDNEIYDTEIDLWFHGHCHCVSDYKINNTRVICNPRGYSHEKTGWDPQLRIDV
jgi:UDP-2,3-diacylglucosamine pyrophosphatase LpxH